MASEAFPPAPLKPIATEVIQLLKDRKESVCVVETAAGGLISSTLLSVPGASKVYRGGVTVYTLESRIAFAGWTQTNIAAYNGPTPAVVAQLATHVRGTLASTYCVAESGTAGPTASGEGENRQPGYVAVAVSADGRSSAATKETKTGSTTREENMILFAKEALELLRGVIQGKEGERL